MLTRTAKRYVIALSIVVFLVALYTVAGFWAVPHFLRSGLTDFVNTHYHRKVALGDIRFNPYNFTLDVADFSLPDSDGEPMLAFGRLHVDLEIVSLWRLGPSFREIVLERPLVRTVVRHDGSLNLADLGKGFPPSPKEPPPKPSEPMRLFIDRFAVIAGGGTFEDLSHATPFHAEFKPIAFELHNFSTRAKSNTGNGNEYSLTAASPEGERLDWNGTFLLEPLSSHGTFAVTDLHASTIWSYLQQPLPLEIPAGTIAVKGEYNFDIAGDAPAIKINVHDTTVSDLRLRPRQGTMDYVVLGKLDVQETQVDLTKRAVEIGKISLTGGEVNAWLSAQGQLNLLELTTPAGGGAAASAGGPPAAAAPGPGSTSASGGAPGASTATNGTPDGAAAGSASVAAGASGSSTTVAQASGPTSAANGTPGGATAGSASTAAGAGGSSATVAQTSGPTPAPGGVTAASGTPPANGTAGSATSPSGAPASAPAWTVSAPDITVDGFKVSAEDRQVTPALALVLNPINIHVAGYNTTPAAHLDITAKTSINSSATLNATAQLSPAGGDVTAHVDLAQLDLPMFQPFIAQRTAMTLQGGKLTTQLDIKKGADGTLGVKGDVDVTGLKSVDELQQSFIKWKDLRVAGMQYTSQPASLQIASITAREPYARVIIAPNRTVNVQVVLAGPSKGGASLATQLGAANAKAGGVTVAGVKGGPPGQDDVKRAKAAASAAEAATADASAGGNGAKGAADANAGAKDAKAAASATQAAAADANAKATSASAAAPAAAVPAAAADAKAGVASAAASATAAAADANAKLADAAASASDATANAKAAGATRGAHRGRKSRSRSGDATVAGAPESAQSSAPAMPMSIGSVRVIDGSVNYADFWIQPNFAVGIQQLNGTIDGLSSDPKSRAKVKLEGKVDRYAPVSINGELNLMAATVYTDIKMSFKGLELTTMTPYSGHFAGYKIDKGKLSVDLSYKVDQRKLDAEQHFVIDQLQLGEAVESPDAVHLPLKLAVALLKDRNGVIDLPLPITGSLDDPQFKIGPIIWHALVNLLEKAVTAPFAAIGRLFGGHGEDMKFIDFAPGSAELDASSKQKLDGLTKALQEHTQLQLDVPLVYSPELDGPVLAKQKLDQKLIARAHGDKPPKKQVAQASNKPAQPDKLGDASRGTAAQGASAAQVGSAQGDAAAPAIASASQGAVAPASASQVATAQGAAVAQGGASQSTAANTPPPAPPAPVDPALANPLEHYRLLLAEFQAEMGKDTELPPTAAANQNAKNKKDAPAVETAIPELEAALIGQIEVPDVEQQALGKRRTRAIQDVLLADGGIDASRVFIINAPAKTDDSGNVRVEMALK
jgi:hypothetical protein